ncbi:hypothetical protein [Polaromonas sp.]|jgi:hypothetical protein|uniref:hypothetical protein n=1 Tax=Polaromonas sp. TaxID=1869339 RepID=UPI0037CAB814
MNDQLERGFQAWLNATGPRAAEVTSAQLRCANQVLRNLSPHAEKATDVDLVTYLLTLERQA